MVGIIKPTKRSGSFESVKLLPEGIGVIPCFDDVRHGKIEEFRGAIPAYEKVIAGIGARPNAMLEDKKRLHV